ncbi:hypothetical protein HYF16_000255 [Salmonella enterica]|nr:hypothetical protein [Salmonella enterica]
MSGFRNIKIPVQIGRWSDWYDLQSYVGKNKYTISFENLDSFQDSPFEVQVRYMTTDGLKIASAFGPGEYTIEGEGAGTDQIRIRSYAAIFGQVMVTVPD